MPVVFNDKPWRELVAQVADAATVRVRAGIFDGAIAKIAITHEYGSPRKGIPERSWLRSTLTDRADELQALQVRVGKLILERKIDGHKAMMLVGAWLVGALKEQIMVKGKFVQVSPATQARKGPNKTRPLVNTGQMAGSVTLKDG